MALVPITVLGLVILALGGWQCVMWGIFLRTVFGLHTTWLVNSATHTGFQQPEGQNWFV
jgi:stearoyl-CoA desaturase (delta-9 desaturase)